MNPVASSRRTRGAIALAGLALFLGSATAALAASPTLKAAKLCRKTLTTEGRTYYRKRLQLLLACADRLLKCEINLEVDGTNPNSCRSSAEDSCNARLGSSSDTTLSKAKQRFHNKGTLACLALDLPDMLSTGSGGLWYGNDGTCNGSADVPTLVDCVRDRVGALADAAASITKPRAGLLLDNAGLGADFPDLARPPTMAIVVGATAPGSGVLVSPGTINLPQGTALQFTGDSTTLPCGGGPGMNGKLTITVGSGPTAQEVTLKETYGPTRVAIFGPYVAAAMIPYTLDLKDSSCMDTVSDDVVIP